MKKLYFLNEKERERISNLHNKNVKEKYLVTEEKQLLNENWMAWAVRALPFLMRNSKTGNPSAPVSLPNGGTAPSASVLSTILSNPTTLGWLKGLGLVGLAGLAWEYMPGKRRPEEEGRNREVYENYVVKCDFLIENKDLSEADIDRKARKIYNYIGKVIYHLTPEQAAYLAAEIKDMKTAGNYCAVDKKFMNIVKTEGTGSSWDASGYNFMHEIISHVFYENAAFENSFISPLSYLKGWSAKIPTNFTSSTKSNISWANSNLTENPNPSNDFNCVKYAYKENSSPFRGGNAKYVDKKFLTDPNDSNKLSNLYYYYGKELRYFSDGKWQDRKDLSKNGEYRCGPGEGIESIIISGKESSTKKEGGGGVIPTPSPSLNCNQLGKTKISFSQLSELRKLIGSNETDSSLTQREINLIFEKIKM
jgi:hypothetical protein